MREIKFRGFDEENNCWRYGWCTRLVEGARVFDAIICFDDGILTRYYIHDNATIGQFTGLHDKNGVEIYEGDIVKFTWWWFDGVERESGLTGTIVYSPENMSFQLKGVKNKEWGDFVGADENDRDYLTPFSELTFSDADFEIIGNIHEEEQQCTSATVE